MTHGHGQHGGACGGEEGIRGLKIVEHNAIKIKSKK